VNLIILNKKLKKLRLITKEFKDKTSINIFQKFKR